MGFQVLEKLHQADKMMVWSNITASCLIGFSAYSVSSFQHGMGHKDFFRKAQFHMKLHCTILIESKTTWASASSWIASMRQDQKDHWKGPPTSLLPHSVYFRPLQLPYLGWWAFWSLLPYRAGCSLLLTVTHQHSPACCQLQQLESTRHCWNTLSYSW